MTKIFIIISLLISGLKFILISVLLVSPVFSEESGEEVKSGLYFLHRTTAPEYFVTGVVLDELSTAHFMNMVKVTEGLSGKWGRVRTLFNKEDKHQVKITVAVYNNVAEAEDSVLELLNDMSAVLKPGSKSGSVIGTHSWYLVSPQGSGAVVFTYNNSLFQVFSSDYNLAESNARSIVDDLKRGTNGVRLGRQVVPPKITDVKFPEEVKEMREIPLILEGQDPDQQKISFVVSPTRGQLLETKKSNEKIYIPYEVGIDELKIYAINEMNVVSQVYIKKIEVEKEK